MTKAIVINARKSVGNYYQNNDQYDMFYPIRLEKIIL